MFLRLKNAFKKLKNLFIFFFALYKLIFFFVLLESRANYQYT